MDADDEIDALLAEASSAETRVVVPEIVVEKLKLICAKNDALPVDIRIKMHQILPWIRKQGVLGGRDKINMICRQHLGRRSFGVP